ncbi:hypothetical protein NW762_010954 [Fusarium torreyae]|uniref:Uncharacterized protein n=1 Tax=Fusarium torreyae TaxID=1237075 RepID=A0A9W8RRZ8_9HYPO|nr:hypothetical protein NW762_010954 [Fusarium torreyae]
MGGWRLSALKARFQEKQQDTPTGFTVDETRRAFWIDNVPESDTLLLLAQSDNEGQPNSPKETIPIDNEKIPAVDADLKDIIGWYQGACTKAQEEWSSFGFYVGDHAQTELNRDKYYLKESNDDSGSTAARRIWMMRGFFIGPDCKHAPPYVTVLCSDKKISERLVKAINTSLDRTRYPGWGVTRLPKVKVLEYGSSSDDTWSDEEGKSDSGDEETSTQPDHERWAEADSKAERNLEKIRVEFNEYHSFPTMTNDSLPSWTHQEHRAGIRLEISRDAIIVSKGTVGGIVKVGDKLYGLTASHALFSLNVAIADQQNPLDDRNRLSTPAAGESGNTNSQEILTILNTWQENRSTNREFDWALIEIPRLRELNPDQWDNVNLVQTVAGDFRPVAVASDMPRHLTQIALATPHSTHCLRGVFVGSEALMGILSSETIHTPWVLRMERPWLIRSGDSGSWAFNAHTGELLGILVGGCPDLLEAYILPAQEVFDSIEKHLGGPVKLANCQPIDRESSVGLARTADMYERLQGRIERNVDRDELADNMDIEELEDSMDLEELKDSMDLEELEDIDDSVEQWVQGNRETFSEIARSPYTLRSPRSSWKSPLITLRYSSLQLKYTKKSRREKSSSRLHPDMLRKSHWDRSLDSLLDQCEESYCRALSSSPQICYNFISGKLAGESPHGFDKGTLPRKLPERFISKKLAAIEFVERELLLELRKHFMLDKNTDFFSIKDILADETNHRVIENEVQLMSRLDPHGHNLSRIPWDRRTLTSIINEMESRIEGKIGYYKKQHLWSSLPESKASTVDLENNYEVILTALLVRDDAGFALVANPPLLAGPTVSSNLVKRRPLSRLPFKIGNKSPQAAEAMKETLLEDLNLGANHYRSVDKLPIPEQYSNIYLKEHGRRVEMVMYDLVLQPGSKLEDLRLPDLPDGWKWGFKSDFSDFATPFGWLSWML